jgi:hypothetical protein
MTLKGTIVQTAMPEDESGDKMYPSLAVVLDNPVCPATGI